MKNYIQADTNEVFRGSMPLLMAFAIALCISIIIYLPFLATQF